MRRARRYAILLALAALLPGLAQARADRRPFGDELSRPQYGRDRTVDVEHYVLDVAFDPERREVRGRVAVTLSPLNDGLRSVTLDAGPMELGRITLEAPEDPPSLLYRHDGARLEIALPRPYAAGESLTLNIEYSARPRSGLYFVGPDEAYPDKPSQVWSQGETERNHNWFPCFDYPNDKATFEEIYTVPADWTAIGNGELLKVTEDRKRGTRSFHYSMAVPNVSYLVSVVAGRMERYADELDGIPVEYFVPAGTGEATARRSFGRTPEMLRFFSERTGVPYPYAKYAQSCAVDFIFGGMENVSATTQTVETLHDEIAALEFESHPLVAHEAAHQWFGDLLTCADWSHAWLNEGFATYWENLWWEHAEGPDEFLYRMLGDRDRYLEEDREEYRRPIVEHRYTDPIDVFDAHLYPKGAWVLHMLRGVLGDEAFFKALRHYTQKFRGQVVETVDLRRAIAEATGVNLERFFEHWLYHGGHPELRVTRDWRPDDGLLLLRFEQTQTVDELTPLFALPLRIAVDTTAGTLERVVRLERAVHELTIALDAEPRLVRVDPEAFVLMELEHERPVRETARALRENPNVLGRIYAARALGKTAAAADGAAPLAAALSDDPFYGVRIEAAAALGKLRGAEARSALVAGLRDPDARVRKAAAKALGAFRDDAEAARALKTVLDGERAYGPRAAATLALAKIRAADAREIALRALGQDSFREQIRVAGLEALAELGEPADLAVLLEWSSYGKPPRARTAAIRHLPKLAGGERAREQATDRLTDLLDDPYMRARLGAMEALAKLGVAAAIEPLGRSARVETDARLRRRARRAIREIREAAAGANVQQLAAEVERLREETRAQSARIEILEKQLGDD